MSNAEAPASALYNLNTQNQTNLELMSINLEEIEPCENFTMVASGIFRAAFPKKRNFGFLKKLKLKSILTLILEDYPTQNKTFLQENNIKFFQFGVAGNKVQGHL